MPLVLEKKNSVNERGVLIQLQMKTRCKGLGHKSIS